MAIDAPAKAITKTADRQPSRVWFRFLGELALFLLAVLWFVYQPGFEPAIVALTAAGSLITRIFAGRSTVRNLALLAVCALLVFTVFKLRIPIAQLYHSLVKRVLAQEPLGLRPDPGAVDPGPRILHSGLRDQDYAMADDGSKLLTRVLATLKLSEIRHAANEGDREAQYLLGVAYSDGQGLPRNESAARRWFERSAQQGFARAQYALGDTLRPSEPAEAMKWLNLAAEKGVARAEISLGAIYYLGQGAPKDVQQASRHFERALDLGFPEAGYQIALIFQDSAAEAYGRGDLEAYEAARRDALEYFQWSAAQDEPLSQLELGRKYRFGIQVERNARVAADWYQKAAKHDVAEAWVELGLMAEEEATGAGATPAEAAGHLRKAVQLGSVRAMELLAERITNKRLAPESPGEHVDLLQKAVARGSAWSALSLAGLYQEGTDVPKNLRLSADYASTALKIAERAPLGDNSANPVTMARAAFHLQRLQAQGVSLPAGTTAAALKERFGPPQEFRHLKIPDLYGNQLDVYLWDWGRDEPPTESQFAWYSAYCGCDVAPEAKSSFRRLYTLSRENKTSYKELVLYALSLANEPQKQEAPAPK